MRKRTLKRHVTRKLGIFAGTRREILYEKVELNLVNSMDNLPSYEFEVHLTTEVKEVNEKN